MRTLSFLVLALAFPAAAAAQQEELVGTYRAFGSQGAVILSLREAGRGLLDGTYTVSGRTSEVELEVARDGSFKGWVMAEDGRIWVEGSLADEVLSLQVYETDLGGDPNPSSGRELFFERSEDEAAPASGADPEQANSGGEPTQPLISATVWDYNAFEAHQWRQDLSGLEVTYVASGGVGAPPGEGIQAFYDLCYDGLFTYEITRTGPRAGTELGTGEWRVGTNAGVVGLELIFDHGGLDRLILQRRGDAVYANGVELELVASGQCR